MARLITGPGPLDMTDDLTGFFARRSDTVLVANSTTIRVLTPDDTVLTHSGSFRYSGGELSGGVLRGIRETDGRTLEWQVTGIAIGHDDYFSFIDVDDDNGLREFALRGNDLITGNRFDDTLAGFDGDDVIKGMAGNDRLLGGDGDDTLIGGAGTDSLLGGSGDDRYVVDSAGDVVLESNGAGTDTVVSSVDYTLSPIQELENLILKGAAVSGTGNGLGNLIVGNGRANTLDGSSGDDTLSGGGGRDVLLGGDGDDLIIWDPIDTSIAGGADTDTLKIATGMPTLNLARIPDDRITGIEELDLTAGGRQKVVLTADDVLAISDTDTLRIDGSSQDRVTSTGQGWVQGADVVDGDTYHSYTVGGATLLVDADIVALVN